jgi:hypothetical protein
MLRVALLGPAMFSSSRTLVPALVLSAVVAANGASLSAQPDPDMTGTAPETTTRDKTELRPSQETVPAEKRPVRVILPSPYSRRR